MATNKHSLQATSSSPAQDLISDIPRLLVVVLIDGYFTRLPIHDLGKRQPGEVVGILHVHTNVSHDGGGTLEGAIKAARDANLDFITITEHNVAFDPSRLSSCD